MTTPRQLRPPMFTAVYIKADPGGPFGTRSRSRWTERTATRRGRVDYATAALPTLPGAEMAAWKDSDAPPHGGVDGQGSIRPPRRWGPTWRMLMDPSSRPRAHAPPTRSSPSRAERRSSRSSTSWRRAAAGPTRLRRREGTGAGGGGVGAQDPQVALETGKPLAGCSRTRRRPP